MDKRRNIHFIFSIVLITIICHIGDAATGERIQKIKLYGAINEPAPFFITISDLEQLSLTEYPVFNPYRKKTITYKGVLMKELVKKFGQPGVTKIMIGAIDGYQSEFIIQEWQKWNILFAFKADGELMGPDRNGPLKVIMPYDTSPDMDRVLYEPKWIWAINKITFKK